MAVTKWELLLVLQMSAKDIKTICQFLNGEYDPLKIDINSLYFLLVLTNSQMELQEKVTQMVKFIIFDSGGNMSEDAMSEGSGEGRSGGGGGNVTRDEFRYMFQIAYQLLNRITDLDLIGDPLIRGEQDFETQYGCAAEYGLDKELFMSGGEVQEEVDFKTCVTKITKQADIHRFFQIFKSGKINVDISIEGAGEGQDAANADSAPQDYTAKQDLKIAAKEAPKLDLKSSIQQNLKTSLQSSMANNLLKNLPASSVQPTQRKQPFSKESMRVIVNDKGYCDSSKDDKANGNEAEIYNIWGSKINQNASPYCVEKMSKRILEIRNENHKILQVNDLADNLQKMQNNIELINSKSLEFYSQRQILQFMRTLNSHKTAKELPPDQGSRILQRVIAETTASNNVEQAILSVKTTLRNTLDEYLQQSYSQLKYENAQAKAQMNHFMSQGHLRGQKRSLEKKKYKLLGQIQTLKSIYSSLFENTFDTEILQKDRLYDQIYKKIHALYNSRIDHQFLIDFIKLKNQKRESKRFINFMEGAKKEMDFINSNEFLNYSEEIVGIPSIYNDAKILIDQKYQHVTKSSHVKLMQKYAFNKIQMCNYFINLGKLKAFHEIFNISTKGEDVIREIMTHKIKKLRTKQERIDIQLIQYLQTQQIKQKIVKQFYSSLGQLAVVKCGKKGLDFKHIYDYMSLAIIKHRTQESNWLLLSIKNNKDEKELYDNSNPTDGQYTNGLLMQKLDGDSLAALIKLQKMKLIDKMFDCGETDSQDSGINHAKYIDVLETQAKICQKKVNGHKNFKPLETSQADKLESQQDPEYLKMSTRSNLQGIYQLMGCKNQFDQICIFQDNDIWKSKGLVLDAQDNSKYDEMLMDLEMQDHFLFDFYPFTIDEQSDQNPIPPEQKDQNILEYIKSVSTSLGNIKFDEQRKEAYNEKKIAYKIVAQFMNTLVQYEEPEFEDLFKQQRDPVYQKAIEILFKINKKGFLNGFNLKFLSLSVEHSMINNYQSYQVLKMYLKEQMKSKTIADISLIASTNQINIPKLTINAFNMQDLNVSQNSGTFITSQATSPKESIDTQQQSRPNSIVRQKTTLKVNQTYKNIFKILNKVENFERCGKQSFFKDYIEQLDHQLNIHEHQNMIYLNIIEEIQRQDKDIFKFRILIVQLISKYIDQQQLAASYENYERSFSIYNKIENHFQIDSIFKGAIKYLESLKHIFEEEVHKDDEQFATNHPQNVNTIGDIVNKLGKDVKTVNKSLNAKYDKQKEDVQAQKSAIASFIKSQILFKNTPKTDNNSGGKIQMEGLFKKPPPAKDPELIELNKYESEIMEQMIYVLTYQDILIISRKYHDMEEFLQEIQRKHLTTQHKKQRISELLNYCKNVAQLSDEQEVANQKDIDNQSRGADIMNAVLSGNIFNSFDIYAAKKLDAESEKNKNMPSIDNSQAIDVQSSFVKSVLGSESIQDCPSPNSRQVPNVYINSNSSKKGTGTAGILTSAQRVVNFLINFLSQICLQEDRLSSRRLLKQSKIFQFGQMLQIDFQEKRMFMTQQYQNKHCLQKLINIYEIQSTPVQKYLQAFEQQSKFVKNELFHSLTEPNQQLLQSQFYHIICRTATSLTKSLINKIDEVFQEAALDDDEKTDFSNAQTKIRKKLDQDLRAFREYLDAEANKKMTEVFESAQKQKEIKFAKCLTSLGLLVRIYYLKQIQYQEDFCYNQELERKTQRVLTFQDEGMIQDNASSQPTQIQAPTREDLKTGHTPLNNNGMVSVDKSR